jgi:hypothetical protein
LLIDLFARIIYYYFFFWEKIALLYVVGTVILLSDDFFFVMSNRFLFLFPSQGQVLRVGFLFFSSVRDCLLIGLTSDG